MNLLELYSLTSGQTIKTIDILPKFYPLDIDKYVIFHPFTKSSKSYSYWQDVVDIILPILQKEGISLVQVGLASEQYIPGCIDLRGKTTINQCVYLCSKALLGLLCDSFISHLAGHYDIPRVILISNNYSSCVSPFFGDKNKQIILEPDRTKRKPSFALDEPYPKQINEIKAENIAESVCKLLGLKFDFPYETIYVGESYHTKILEMVPNSITDVRNLGVDSIVLRMDYQFNDTILQHQMQHCPVSIITDKPINIEILRNYKPRIRQLFYIITKDHDVAFAAAVQKLSIPLQMFSYLPEDELNKFKLSFLDIGTIYPKTIKLKNDIKELKDIPSEKLFYKSSKTTLDSGKIFTSRAALLKNQPVAMINQIVPIIDDETFWKDLEYYMVVREK